MNNYNPYFGSGRWYKGNLHTHSTPVSYTHLHPTGDYADGSSIIRVKSGRGSSDPSGNIF